MEQLRYRAIGLSILFLGGSLGTVFGGQVNYTVGYSQANMYGNDSGDVLQSQNISFVSQVPAIATGPNTQVSIADWLNALHSQSNTSSFGGSTSNGSSAYSYSPNFGSSYSLNTVSPSASSAAPWEVEGVPTAPVMLGYSSVTSSSYPLSLGSSNQSSSTSDFSGGMLYQPSYGAPKVGYGIDPNMGLGVAMELANIKPAMPPVAAAVVAATPTNYAANRLDIFSANPEPATWTLMVLGLAGSALLARRRKRSV